MFVLHKYALASLLKNKKRTLVILIGVIMSCALICGTVLVGESAVDMLIRSEMLNSGNYHVKFTDVDYDRSEQIVSDDRVKSAALTKEIGYAKLDNSQNSAKPYLYLKAFNEKAFDTFNATLVEGRLPQAKNEVVISKQIITNAGVNLEVGDLISLNIGNRVLNNEVIDQYTAFTVDEELVLNQQQLTQYRIVGIIDRLNTEPYQGAGYTVLTGLNETMMTENDKVNVFVLLDNPRRIYDEVPKIASELDLQSSQIYYNRYLLMYMGVSKNKGFNRALRSVLAILISLIIIASVAFIYNAFAISISERKKQFGLLKSIGATPKQIRNIVYTEASIIGAIALPAGILGGIVGIAFTLAAANKLLSGMTLGLKLRLIVSPYVIIATIVFLALTLFISATIPAKRAAKISAIDNIRQSHDIKIARRRRAKKNSLISKIFGFEADLAVKSLRRSQKRYRVTVVSLAISIILYIVFSAFMSSTYGAVDAAYSGYDYNLKINGEKLNSSYTQEMVNLLSTNGHVDKISSLRKLTVGSSFERNKFNDYMFNVFGDYITANGDQYMARIQFVEMSDDKFNEFLIEQGIDPAGFNNTHKGVYVDKSSIVYGKAYSMPLYNLSIGDRVYKSENGIEVVVGAKVQETPFAVPASDYRATVIISASTAGRLGGGFSEQPYSLAIQSTDPDELEQFIRESKMGAGLYIFNISSQVASMKQVKMLIQLLCYGFITIITLIGITNIFNSIDTNIMLRRREFAMLKSAGMSQQGLYKMMNYESAMYGISALVWALPIGLGLAAILTYSFTDVFVNVTPLWLALPWKATLQCSIFVLILIFIVMRYSINKIKHENIIDALRVENL